MEETLKSGDYLSEEENCCLMIENFLLALYNTSIIKCKRNIRLIKFCGKVIFLRMKKEYTPYNFNVKYEYHIYTQIGREYHRKFNGKKQRRKSPISFDKYTEWERYFAEKFLMDEHNTCNFLHYLNALLRDSQEFDVIYKILGVPIYISLVTMVITIYIAVGYLLTSLVSTFLIGLIFIMCVCMCNLYLAKRKIYFYEDCIRALNVNYPGSSTKVFDTYND